MNKTTTTFKEFNENYPCTECNAPCCRYLQIPYKTPTTWMDMDFIGYILNFPKVTVTVSKSGVWGILIQQDCKHLDATTMKCNIHGTSEQPKTCVYFNPYQCNYKLNLNDENPETLYVLDFEKFKYWVQYLKFDKNGLIIDAPDYEKSLEILRDFETGKKIESTSDINKKSSSHNK